LEGWLRKLLEDAKRFSGSTMATLTAAVDLLHELCSPGVPAGLAVEPPVAILVVDDDLVSRRVITIGVQTSFPRPETAENGEDAVALAATRGFDLVFMDVIMPGMDGFAASAKIRDTVLNRSVPVIFVTGQPFDQVGGRVQAIEDADFMVKPYLVAELTVKALTHVLRARLRRLDQPPDSPPGKPLTAAKLFPA
jgi:CheY-like chemotaxis protein